MSNYEFVEQTSIKAASPLDWIKIRCKYVFGKKSKYRP